MNENKRKERVAVSVSPSVRLALEMTAEKNGLPVATQAAMTIRQGMERTMQSEAFKERLRAEKAGWTTAQRLDEMSEEWEMETIYAATKAAETEAAT